jgi:hypothetical protein
MGCTCLWGGAAVQGRLVSGGRHYGAPAVRHAKLGLHAVGAPATPIPPTRTAGTQRTGAYRPRGGWDRGDYARGGAARGRVLDLDKTVWCGPTRVSRRSCPPPPQGHIPLQIGWAQQRASFTAPGIYCAGGGSGVSDRDCTHGPRPALGRVRGDAAPRSISDTQCRRASPPRRGRGRRARAAGRG